MGRLQCPRNTQSSGKACRLRMGRKIKPTQPTGQAPEKRGQEKVSRSGGGVQTEGGKKVDTFRKETQQTNEEDFITGEPNV